MKVNTLVKDYIINSPIGNSSKQVKESIVWFNKQNLKPYIKTRQITENGKVMLAYNNKQMSNGDTFEVFKTKYTTLQVHKNSKGKIKKIQLKSPVNKQRLNRNESFIESFKIMLRRVNEDLFGNI